MENQKHYIIDTNILLEDPKALAKLRNGKENTVYIPYHVLLELDKLKKNSKLAHIVARVIQYLIDNPENYHVLNSGDITPSFSNLVDRHILDEIQHSGLEQPILVTNDKLFQLQDCVELKAKFTKSPYRLNQKQNTSPDLWQIEIKRCLIPSCGTNRENRFFSGSTVKR